MIKDMTVGNPTKLILSFAIPMLIGNIFQQFYNMVDTMIVGRFVGVDALAGVGSTGSMNFLVLGFMIGIASGFSIIISQSFGAGDETRLRKSVAMSVYLSIAITIIVTILSLALTRPLLELMQTPEDIMEHAYTYISIIFAGIIVTLCFNLLSAILRALGDSKTPLLFLVIASLINIVLDLVFIINFKMGVAGAAYATVISQGISCILCFLYMKKKCTILRMKKEDWIIDIPLCKQLLSLGIPNAFQCSVTAIGVMVLQSTINGFGSTIVAAYTAASKVEQLAIQPSMTIGLAVGTYAAQNLGAQKLDRIRLGIRKSIVISFVICISSGILLTLLGGPLTTLFVSGEQQAVIAASKQYISTVSIFFFVLGLLFIYRSTLQGLGNAIIPFWSGVVELIMRVGVALILSRMIGFSGVCLAGPFAWTGAAILLAISYYRTIHRLEKEASLNSSSKNELIA